MWPRPPEEEAKVRQRAVALHGEGMRLRPARRSRQSGGLKRMITSTLVMVGGIYARRDGKKYIKRTGKCNPQKCGAACCKIYSGTTPYVQYTLAMLGHKRCMKYGKEELWVRHICPFLKNGKCSIYAHRPGACRQFPHLYDTTYKLVRRKCSFRFRKITKREFLRLKKVATKMEVKP